MERYAAFQELKIDRQGKILRVTIDNPPINEIKEATGDELSRIFVVIQNDPDVNVVILTASGDRVFCGGGSLDGMIERARAKDYGKWIGLVERSRRMLASMLDLDVPIIARVQGHAIGLGATLALFSDIAIAADHANIADPHVQVGLTAGDGGSLIWPYLIGHSRAKYYLLTGERVPAVEAAQIGLIHKAVPYAELDATVDALAQRLARLSRLAVTTTKRAVNIPLLRDFVAFGDAHAGLEVVTGISQEHLNALSVLQKRHP